MSGRLSTTIWTWMNLFKIEAIPNGALAGSAPSNGFPFHWSTKEITYLGMRTSLSLNKLVKLNLQPIVTLIKEDLYRWGTLPVSWVGRTQ